MLDRGQPTFVKDGVHFGSQVWGTGLVDAVHESPRAEHHARVGRNLIAGGAILGVVGLGVAFGGLLLSVNDDVSNTDNSGAAMALAIGGAAALLAGSLMMITGQAHVYDAINIYNDSLDARPNAPPLGPRQHGVATPAAQ